MVFIKFIKFSLFEGICKVCRNSSNYFLFHFFCSYFHHKSKPVYVFRVTHNVGNMASGGLWATSLSTFTKLGAGQIFKLPLRLPLVILRVASWCYFCLFISVIKLSVNLFVNCLKFANGIKASKVLLPLCSKSSNLIRLILFDELLKALNL